MASKLIYLGQGLIGRISKQIRYLHTTTVVKKFNQPLSTDEMPRYGGVSTMMRLPLQLNDASNLDACFVGIPLDQGTSWRSGTRHGPRSVRQESALIRSCNMATGAVPFESLQVADIGDVPVNPYSLLKTLDIITNYFRRIINKGCVPLTVGGDHTLSLPILRAIREKYGPVAMIHVDAHSDTSDIMFGEKITHGTTFRRAVEEGLLEPCYVYQIGIRGSGYSSNDRTWPIEQVAR